MPPTCQIGFVPENFWSDMSWLNVPQERQTIFIAPQHPRGGLLGGSSDGAPKMSKLQALAAARKKKAQEQKSGSSAEEVSKPLANLSISGSSEAPGVKEASAQLRSSSAATVSGGKERPKTYPDRKRKNSSPHRKAPQPEEPIEIDSSEPEPDILPPASIEQAQPSAFASTMFGGGNPVPSYQPSNALFILPYSTNSSVQSTDAFAGPSPDDVVIAAQSKGAGHSANQRK